MTDRESVIIGLRSCKPSWFTVEKCSDDSCPYNRFGHEDGGCVDHLIDDALELLKEQDLLPVSEGKVNKCTCGHTINRYWHPKFCGFCGKQLIWYRQVVKWK